MLSELAKLREAAAVHPHLWLALLGLALIAILAVFLISPAPYQAIRKLAYLSLNALAVDVGWRELVYWTIVGALVAVPGGLAKGWAKEGEAFHWDTFWFAVLVIAGSQAAGACFHLLTKGGRMLRPVHGAVWRQERKSGTAAIIERINRNLGTVAPNVSTEEIKSILTDLLKVIVLHVRDHRGDHTRVRVFANLLLVDREEMVVVARDPILQTENYRRDTPKRHRKALLAAGRAVESGNVVSVGDLRLQYPEGPQDKPYVSILALPLFGRSSPQPIGALSIDSTRPYFFETFVPGWLENELENSLAPYARTLVLVLETLLSPELPVMIRRLAGENPTGSAKPGG